MALFGLFSKDKKKKLDEGLEKTNQSFLGKISKALIGKSKVDDDFLDELEEILITSDVGVSTTVKIIERLEARVAEDKYLGVDQLNELLKDEIQGLLLDNETQDFKDFSFPTGQKPYVIMVVGVNGVGKTTTIGKLANQFKKQGHAVVLGAGDTFRAAAVAQLKIWGERNDVPVIEKGMNTPPGAVAFDAVKYAQQTNADVVIIDTAGRLHTKINLMNELTAIKKAIEKVMPSAPHEVLLVLDGSTGQNAVVQATEFTKATDVSSLAITKLDGTAKGGVVIGISDQFKVPVKYIGVGEGIDDLQIFNKKEFVDSFFKKG